MIADRLEALASKRLTWVIVLLLCLGLRLGAAFYKGDGQVLDKDAHVWMEIAHNLSNGHGFALGGEYDGKSPTAYSEPGYPSFLAAVYRTIGDDPFDIYVAQSVMDTITCFVLMLLVIKATGGRKLAAVLTGLAYSIYPPFIMSTCTPMTETFSTFAITIALFAAACALEGGLWASLAAGTIMGLAMLARSPMTFFPVVIVVLLFLRRRITPRWITKSIVYSLAAYVVLAPWVIRNYVVMHSFVLVPTRGAMAFWGATGVADGYTLTNWEYPVDTAGIDRYPDVDSKVPNVSYRTYVRITSLQERMRKMGEIEKDRALKEDGIRAIREHPGRFAFLGVKKVFRLWFNLWYDWPASSSSMAIAVLNAIILMLALLGFRRVPLGGAYKAIIAASCIYVTLISVISCAVVRYSYPVMPMVLAPAACYVAWLIGRDSWKSVAEHETDRL